MKKTKFYLALLVSSCFVNLGSVWSSDSEAGLKDFEEVKIMGAERVSDILSHQALSTLWKKNEDIWKEEEEIFREGEAPVVPEEENITLEQYAALRLKSTTPAVTKAFEDLKLLELQHRMAESAVAAEAEKLLNLYFVYIFKKIKPEYADLRKQTWKKIIKDPKNETLCGPLLEKERKLAEHIKGGKIENEDEIETYLDQPIVDSHYKNEKKEILEEFSRNQKAIFKNGKEHLSEALRKLYPFKVQAYELINILATPHSLLALLLKPSFIEEEEFKTFYDQAKGLRYFRQKANKLEHRKKGQQENFEELLKSKPSVQVWRTKESETYDFPEVYLECHEELGNQSTLLRSINYFCDLEEDKQLETTPSLDEVEGLKIQRLKLNNKLFRTLLPEERENLSRENAHLSLRIFEKQKEGNEILHVFWTALRLKDISLMEKTYGLMKERDFIDQVYITSVIEGFSERLFESSFYEMCLEDYIKIESSHYDPEILKKLLQIYLKNKEGKEEKIKQVISKLNDYYYAGLELSLLIQLEPYTEGKKAEILQERLKKFEKETSKGS